MSHWFDDLLRRFAATTTSRRGALKLLAVGLATGLLGSSRAPRASAEEDCQYLTLCRSVYWNDDRTGSAWLRERCYDGERYSSQQCLNLTPQSESWNIYQMVRSPGVFTARAEVYVGECRIALDYTRLSGPGSGAAPADQHLVTALADPGQDGDPFATLDATPVGPGLAMVKLTDPSASTTATRDDRLPPACACGPGLIQTCGRCCEPVRCGQPLNCCTASGGCGTLHPDLGCIERCT
jgi:hypothetical protein